MIVSHCYSLIASHCYSLEIHMEATFKALTARVDALDKSIAGMLTSTKSQQNNAINADVDLSFFN